MTLLILGDFEIFSLLPENIVLKLKYNKIDFPSPGVVRVDA